MKLHKGWRIGCQYRSFRNRLGHGSAVCDAMVAAGVACMRVKAKTQIGMTHITKR